MPRTTLLRLTSGLLLVMGVLVMAACVGAMPDRREVVAGDPIVAAGMTTFGEQCTACHTIGSGPLVGPDLAGVELGELQQLVDQVAEPDGFFEQKIRRSPSGEMLGSHSSHSVLTSGPIFSGVEYAPSSNSERMISERPF